MTTLLANFSKNLKYLCASQPSIAQVCRDIGIRPQQFNRYVNGWGMPSAHNLLRILDYFGISEDDIMTEHELFKMRHRADPRPMTKGPLGIMDNIFKNQAAKLRRYLGLYHGYYVTPSWAGAIIRNVTWLREEDGYVISHSFERARSVDGIVVQKIRYAGLATYRGGRICIVESAKNYDGLVAETILNPATRHDVNILQGMTISVGLSREEETFSARAVLKRIPDRVSAREALEATGNFSQNSMLIDPVVKRFLGL